MLCLEYRKEMRVQLSAILNMAFNEREGCISPLVLGITFLFFPGNITFLFQALLEGFFHVFSLLIKPHPCNFSLVQILSVMIYSFRIKCKLA